MVKYTHQDPHSCLLHITTEHKTSSAGNHADFHVILGNTYKVKRTLKIVPIAITIPHQFTNVGQHSHRLLVNDTETNLTQKQYTDVELAAELTSVVSAVAGGVVLFTITDGYLTVDNQTASPVSLKPAPEQGFTFDDDLYSMLGLIPDPETIIPATSGPLTSTTPVNIAPVQTVIVCSSVLAPANAISSDGKAENVLEIIDLSNIPFQGSAHKQIDDIKSTDVNHNSEVELDRIDITLCDTKYRPLYLPPNYHPQITLKVYHKAN